MNRHPWAVILMHYAAGVFAAAQLGKVAALAPLIAADLGFGLVTISLATSLIEIGGATLGVLAGGLAGRLGLRATLLGALACLVVGSAGAGTAQGAATLIAWRVLEAAGYLGVIVSAPVLIMQAAGPARQGTALALWSSFVPVGLALGAWAHAAVAALASWRVAMFASAGVGALVLIAMSLLMPRAPAATDHPPGTRPSLRAPRAAWCLAASFGLYALFQVGVLALLPSLYTRGGMSVSAAATWTGFAALATLIGSVTAAWLLRHGHALKLPSAIALVVPALLGFAVFTPGGLSPAAPAIAIVLNIVSGVFASLAFALVPRVAGGIARMPQANGLLAQFGASGSLLGPPLLAAAAEHGGWGAAATLGLVVSALAVPLALMAISGAEPAPVRSPAQG